jgi:hypothetical protein
VRTSDMPFAVLRRLLLDLDFAEKTGPSAQRVFEHFPSDTVLVFRGYELNEKVNLPDLISVRKQLDERGLLAADSFDTLLRKTPA